MLSFGPHTSIKENKNENGVSPAARIGDTSQVKTIGCVPQENWVRKVKSLLGTQWNEALRSCPLKILQVKGGDSKWNTSC